MAISPPIHRFALPFCLGALLTLAAGCNCCQKSYWREARPINPWWSLAAREYLVAGTAGLEQGFREPRDIVHLRSDFEETRAPQLAYFLAEATYSMAAKLERAENECCVDYYYQAVAFAWHARGTVIEDLGGQVDSPRPQRLYASSLQQLLVSGQRFGRLDPRCGLRLETPSGPLRIPAEHQGFLWKADDFDQLQVVGDYADTFLTKHYVRGGLGVPVVVLRCGQDNERAGEDEFFPARHSFAATVVLCPNIETVLSSSTLSSSTLKDSAAVSRAAKINSGDGALRFYDPHRTASVCIRGNAHALASDITAPLAFARQHSNWNPYLQFLGRENGQAKLLMLEPYQARKIPVLFVHGLASDPKAYFEMANELRADPWFYERFQIWAFEYPTGSVFLESAAKLRRQLQRAYQLGQERCPEAPPLHGVIVGHSMGGLMSKLQVTESQDTLWRQVANRPLDQLVVAENTRQKLAQAFYFSPSPHLTRVVFIATPHDGSPWAKRCVGRIASAAVRFSPEDRTQLEEVIRDNPGVFHPRIANGRLPTSIDLLEKGSPVLSGIRQLPIDPRVRIHSIIGTGQALPLAGPADGVVPVDSARHPGAQSECFIDALHIAMASRPETIQETMRILRIHAEEELLPAFTMPRRQGDKVTR